MPQEDRSELYLKALKYAKENNLDINNREDVVKIVEELDPTHATRAEIDDFQYQLQNAQTFLDIANAK